VVIRIEEYGRVQPSFSAKWDLLLLVSLLVQHFNKENIGELAYCGQLFTEGKMENSN
jgi:hypothetical protein